MWRLHLALLLPFAPAGAQSPSAPSAPPAATPPAATLVTPSLSATGAPPASLTWADCDADGDLDLVVLVEGTLARLFQNEAGRSFQDITASAGLAGILGATQAAWADFDQDGRPDLLLVVPGGESRLFRGLEGPRFEEVHALAELEAAFDLRGVAVVDLDGDGAPDLVVQTPTRERVLRNLGRGRFQEIALDWPPRVVPAGGVGAASAPGDAGAQPGGATGGFEGATAGGGGPFAGRTLVGPHQAASSALFCAGSIEDLANPGTCMNASTTPTLGLLYPLSSDLFVSAAGRVGLGTLTPADRLHVEGRVRASGQFISTVAGSAPLVVSSSVKVAGFNADLLDGLDSGAFRLAGQPILSADIADGAILDADVSLAAGIAGVKILPSFGAQNVVTTGRGGFGTVTPNSTLHVNGAAGLDPFRVQTNGNTKLLVGSGGGVAVGANVATPPTNGLYVAGDVGLGTSTPASKLHVEAAGGNAAAVQATSPQGVNYGGYFVAADLNGTAVWGQATGSQESTGVFGLSQSATGTGVRGQVTGSGVNYGVFGSTSSSTGFAGYFTGGKNHFGGRVGVGTTTPLAEVHVAGIGGNADLLLKRNDATHGFNVGVNAAPKLFIARTDGTTYNDFLTIDGVNGNVGIGTANPSVRLDVNGATRTTILTITGGSDLAERFEVSPASEGAAVEPGLVVVIDPARPGELIVASQPYDRRVAGVISGANGLSPGMVMSAEGDPLADGTHHVALTGRVWCRADASGAAIEPGDLLTTSAVPGHAMKAEDAGRTFGAVIGKAMTPLAAGERGLVLVLVNLH